MKKFILKLELHNDKEKRRALKTVSTLSGIDSITINMKEKTVVVVGTVDPITVVSKLRKFWPANIVFVGPAKEPEKKKEEPKKDDGKKEDPKKDDGKKDDAKKEEGKKDESKKEDGKKDDASKEEPKKPAPPQPMPGMFMPYRPPYYHPGNNFYNYQQYQPPQQYQPYQQYLQYHPYQQRQPYQYYQPYQPRHHSIEENPNGCIIS